MRLYRYGLMLLGMLAAGSPALAQSSFIEGAAAFERGDYRTAADKFEDSCNSGGMQGCNYLGALYFYGGGVTQDKARAAALYNQACNGGFADGCYNLGNLYYTGEGVTQDKARAAAFYKQVCNGVDKDGCNALYKQICDRGDTDGCNALKLLTGSAP